MNPLVSYPQDPDMPTSDLPFSPCVRVGDLVFVSGQASVDANGQIVSDTFEGEFRRSVENMAKVLRAAGCGLEHVVQTRNYVRDAADVPLYNQLYREYFKAPFPARTTITNCLPPTLKFEIECVAAVPRPVQPARVSSELAPRGESA
ncbi:MAG TPA: RidA family protein [Verrucomicrobiae bacterium]|jgi:2-iminobutanoate/2-iminopropanoate deaminase